MKDYTRNPSHVRRLRSKKNQALSIMNAMISAFDNEDYNCAYHLSIEAQESLGSFWATFNTYRGFQENGVRDEAWAR